jgi:hypothetical protein
MARKTPPTNVDAFRFVQISSMETLHWGLLLVKPSPTKTFAKIFDLWEKTLCPKAPSQKWFSLLYVRGDCPKCGFHILSLCNYELVLENGVLMFWRRF